MPLNSLVLKQLHDIFPPSSLFTKVSECWNYGYDNSRQHALPDAVVIASSHQDICALAALCHHHHIPLTVRGRGTGTTGAVIPEQGGIVLSMEKMNKIIEIDTANRFLRAETGVTNQQVQIAAQQQGFFWPPDPTSSAFCSIGGNLAYNSAGPRAVKYGTPRENTLGLRCVTAQGNSLQTGTCTTKGVVGYDLTRLLIGSEGTLAIITEATLKLTPLPECKRTLQVMYKHIEGATQAVSDIMAQAIIPCALEFIDKQAIDMIRDYAQTPLHKDAQAMLMIEVDGSQHAIDAAVQTLVNIAQNASCLELHTAETEQQVQQLWKIRKALSPALRKIAPKKINEDVVVPVSHIPTLIQKLALLAEKYHIRIVNFGHAGNGNIHVNLLINPDDPDQLQRAEACLDEVFTTVLSLRGSLSGEHGIGIEKRPFIERELDPTHLQLMAGIKQQFDPHNILNPGKIPFLP